MTGLKAWLAVAVLFGAAAVATATYQAAQVPQLSEPIPALAIEPAFAPRPVEAALREIASELSRAESARLVGADRAGRSSEIEIHFGGHKLVFVVECDPDLPRMRRLVRRGLRETHILASNVPPDGFQATESGGEWVLTLKIASWDWAEPGAEESATITVRR